MGSAYFYLEFLMAWLSILEANGFKNPAIFALEYTLAPDAVFPSQVVETFAGYRYCVNMMGDSNKVCVAGDSAGATLILSMLLDSHGRSKANIGRPGCSILISPWVTLVSEKKYRSESDYLDKDVLHRYAYLYVGSAKPDKPTQSPGNCTDTTIWTRICPHNGWLMIYGSEEVFNAEIIDFAQMLSKAGIDVKIEELLGFVHAWPIVAFYLGSEKQQQLGALRIMVDFMSNRLKPKKSISLSM